MDYTVTVEVSVTADSPKEAAKFALDDLRDEAVGPWNMDVSCSRGKKTVTIGDPNGHDDNAEHPQVTYLTNACGEDTGYGSLPLEEADYAKVAFEQGPGVVLPYIVEIEGAAFVLGNLEVAYKDDFWGDDGADMKPQEDIRSYCKAACDYILARITDGMRLLPLDEGYPGRIIIGVAIPLDDLADSEATSNALRQAFGEMVELPGEVPAI